MHEPHCAAAVVRAVALAEVLIFFLFGLQRRLKRGKVSRSLDHGHRSDPRQLLNTQPGLRRLALMSSQCSPSAQRDLESRDLQRR